MKLLALLPPRKTEEAIAMNCVVLDGRMGRIPLQMTVIMDLCLDSGSSSSGDSFPIWAIFVAVVGGCFWSACFADWIGLGLFWYKSNSAAKKGGDLAFQVKHQAIVSGSVKEVEHSFFLATYEISV